MLFLQRILSIYFINMFIYVIIDIDKNYILLIINLLIFKYKTS